MELATDGMIVAVSHVSPIKAIICWALDLDDSYAWRLRLDVRRSPAWSRVEQAGPVELQRDRSPPPLTSGYRGAAARA